MNTVVHFELPANDAVALTNFFSSVFGWSFQQFGNDPYFLTTANAKDGVGIGGAIMQRRDPQQPLVNSIEVENIDAMIPVIEANGGRIVVPRMAVPSVGYLAYFMDPESNIHGLWQKDETAA